MSGSWKDLGRNISASIEINEDRLGHGISLHCVEVTVRGEFIEREVALAYAYAAAIIGKQNPEAALAAIKEIINA